MDMVVGYISVVSTVRINERLVGTELPTSRLA